MVDLKPTSNPNAAIGGAGGGAGLGTLIVWIANKYLDAGFSPEAGAAIAGGVATVVLWVGRDGIHGIARRVWSGAK